MASGLAAGMVFGGAATAQAAPALAPDNGLVSGGETVVVPAPEAPELTFTQVAAGLFHSLALGSDGKTYAWGRGQYGQLGDGTSGHSLPGEVNTGGVTFAQLSVGANHSLALDVDGNVYAWGYGAQGQLGNGTTENRPAPTKVDAGGMTFTQISAGAYHSLAIGTDGNTYAWGYNWHGRLGDGTTTTRNTPVLVNTGGVTFTQVSAGELYSMAIGSDGNTYAWGYNTEGQLGNGTTTGSLTPVQVSPAGAGFTQISAGNTASLALGSDGNVYAWGQNDLGQLGDGTTTNRSTPAQVNLGGATFSQVWSASGTSLALASDGNMYAWGQNDLGQLGDGTTTNSAFPVQVSAAGNTFTRISTGTAISSNGKTYVWGPNSLGHVAEGSEPNSASPIPLQFTPDTVVVTGVTFDGLDGTTPGDSASTAPLDNADGTWSIVTPEHAVGSVDVVVSWTLNGEVQTPVTYAGGFTYRPLPVAPTITSKNTVDVFKGTALKHQVTATGEPAPTSFTVAGKLPAGVKMSTTGLFSGTPTVVGVYPVTVTVSNGVNPSATQKLTIKVAQTALPLQPCTTPRTTPVFADTPLSQKFYKEIDWMHCMKYSTGWKQPSGKPLYKPKDQLSREAMAAFIFRMEAPKNYKAPKVSPFADVKTSDTFYREIAWMWESKLSTGWKQPSGKPLYKSKDSLSREAMAAFIFRLQAKTDKNTASYKAPKVSPFADMKKSDKFYREISWMWDAKLSTGNKTAAGKEYWPKDSLSREAMAAFIYRFHNKLNTPVSNDAVKKVVVSSDEVAPESVVQTVEVSTFRGYTLSLTPLGDTSLQSPQSLTDSSFTQPEAGRVILGSNNELQVKIPNTAVEELSFDVTVADQEGEEETVRYILTIAD